MADTRIHKAGLLATTAIGALLVGATVADAGGFAVREQSATFQGSSYAGAAAGGGLSSMFWNPAAIGQAGAGLTTESHSALIVGDVHMTALPGSTLYNVPGVSRDSGNIGVPALVPSSYGAYRLSNNLVLGASFNAPFGLTTSAQPNNWTGGLLATKSQIKTYNLNAVLAYNLGNGLSVAAGPQVEYITGNLRSLFISHLPAAQKIPAYVAGSAGTAEVDATNTGIGFTAGVLWEPSKATILGLGFRSSVSHQLTGGFQVIDVPALGNPGVEASLKTPEIVTFSMRQAVSPQVTALGTVEWTNWSRLNQLKIDCTTGGTALCPVAGGNLNTLQLGWHNGWMVAGGLEYAYNQALTLRTGLAYEKSPIQDATERTIRTPDTDRIWASLGGSYAVTSATTLDLAYSHVFGKTSDIDRCEPVACVPGASTRLVGTVDASVNIFSAAIKTKW